MKPPFLILFSGVTARGRVPPTLLTRKFLLTYREKRSKEKRENGEETNQNQKRKGGKLKMEGGKFQMTRRLFFCGCFSLFKTTEICFVSTKMGIFYWEKAFHAGKKQENDFAPSEKYFSYVTPLVLSVPKVDLLADLRVPVML